MSPSLVRIEGEGECFLVFLDSFCFLESEMELVPVGRVLEIVGRRADFRIASSELASAKATCRGTFYSIDKGMMAVRICSLVFDCL